MLADLQPPGQVELDEVAECRSDATHPEGQAVDVAGRHCDGTHVEQVEERRELTERDVDPHGIGCDLLYGRMPGRGGEQESVSPRPASTRPGGSAANTAKVA